MTCHAINSSERLFFHITTRNQQNDSYNQPSCISTSKQLSTETVTIPPVGLVVFPLLILPLSSARPPACWASLPRQSNCDETKLPATVEVSTSYTTTTNNNNNNNRFAALLLLVLLNQSIFFQISLQAQSPKGLQRRLLRVLLVEVFFYRSDAFPVAQPTVRKHWRYSSNTTLLQVDLKSSRGSVQGLLHHHDSTQQGLS